MITLGTNLRSAAFCGIPWRVVPPGRIGAIFGLGFAMITTVNHGVQYVKFGGLHGGGAQALEEG